MVIPKAFVYCTLFVFLAFCAAFSPLPAQQKDAPDLDKSCRDFVQSFYDWYVPNILSRKPHNPTGFSMGQPLKDRASSFTFELRRRLQVDFDAQDKVKGEIVGLDFDPFLNSQDPSERFVAETVSRKGGSYWVEVFGVSSGQRQEHVVPELVLRNGSWVFVNFHYGKGKFGGDGDLLGILKTLRAERQKSVH